jgi:hypothetical protein
MQVFLMFEIDPKRLQENDFIGRDNLGFPKYTSLFKKNCLQISNDIPEDNL